jgi:hypothetical protein
MHMLLLLMVVISMASVAVAVGVLFLAIRQAHRDADASMREPASAASSFPRPGRIYPTEDTVPSIQSWQPEWGQSGSKR